MLATRIAAVLADIAVLMTDPLITDLEPFQDITIIITTIQHIATWVVHVLCNVLL